MPTNNSRRIGIGATPAASTSSLRSGIAPTGVTRRDSMGIGLGGNIRRSQQLAASSSQAHMRSIDMSAQRSRPQTARSRMTQGLSGSTLKEAAQPTLPQSSSSIYSAGLANNSRISLLSMIAPREDLHHDELPQRCSTENTRLSLGPTVKSTKSSRALSGDHSVSPEGGRPRSKTQSSEQGIVTVFSVAQKLPSLDPDLEALNRLPKYRPLVLAPSNNRLTGLFQSGTRYIEPTAEQLHLDETELTGFCLSFRDYVSNRVHQVCDRQMGFATAARHMSTRAATSQSRLGHVTQLSKHEQGSVSALKSLQRQAEKSYELVQDILRDLERLDNMLPANDRFFAADSVAPREFPSLSKMLVQRRRHSLPASPSPHSSVVLRRQIAAKKAGIPAFPTRTTSLAGIHGRPLSAIPATESGKPRPGPYQLPGLIRHAGANATNRLHSKCSTDTRALRTRGSRGSMTGSESANTSAPVSPTTNGEPRLSFDGETISPLDNTKISALTAHGGDEHRFAYKRASQPFGGLRRPNSAASTYLDSGKSNNYSRSEVSLSREQVVWSPQIAFGASDSAFGFPSFDGASLSPQLALSDVGDEYAEGALDGNHSNMDMADDGHDAASAVSEMKAAFSYGTRSRASSVAHSLKSALEESDAVGLFHATSPSKPHSEATCAGDSVNGFSPTARANPERMSTWSSSSARTLSEGLSGHRVSCAEDSRSSKQPLPSAALSSLAASAAMINLPPTVNEAAGKSLGGTASSNAAIARVSRTRPVADLGLSIRSDLERRVRSFSASEGNTSLSSGARPHSSMGFHNPASGTRPSLWSVRPSSYRTRRHSPHSASIRGFPQATHRLSVVSTDSNSNCQTSRFASMHNDFADQQSDAASISSYSSQATEMLHPSPPVSATAIAGKRRAQTMDLHPLSAL
ncbi:hypothetical protein GGI10_002832 [Coemansia sp. RSA 2530]|nr:hypothetical protein GGI10_002832 [Coemansia sp. RSA 2530]